MRAIVTLVIATALIAAAPPASRAPAQDAPPRPDPVPAITGMVFIPAGDFLMGSTADEVRRMADADEYPQRRVWLDDYYIDIHEVTNAQYKVFVDSMKVPAPPRWVDGNYGIGEDGLPVVSITHEEAAAYAKFVGKRLPTEAEWEKAARGTDGRYYPWGNAFDRTYANNGDHLVPIMTFPSGVSPYGVFDMAGNAAEWVNGHYEAYPRTEPLPQGVPDRREIFKGDRRIYRGGSWNTFPKYLRCSNRESTIPGKRWAYVGFRCVMDPPWKKAAQ